MFSLFAFVNKICLFVYKCVSAAFSFLGTKREASFQDGEKRCFRAALNAKAIVAE